MDSNNHHDYHIFLKSVPPFGDIMGLSGIKAMLEALGNFHEKLHVIHIAGTNGKGSTTKMLSAIYHAAGYQVGTFTSPYIDDYRESTTLNESTISIEAMNQSTALIKAAYESLKLLEKPLPTHYECITLVSLMAMYQSKMDLCIIETLMGGRHDASNVFAQPLASIITNISLDHIDHLGPSIADIAWHKAGIIKPGVPLVVNNLKADALAVIQKEAALKQSTLIDSPAYCRQHYSDDLMNTYINHLSLKGKHQVENMKGVLTVIDLLQDSFSVSSSNIEKGLSSIIHLYRLMPFLHKGISYIFDGGHNAEGISSLCNYLQDIHQGKQIVFILGILTDKDYTMIADTIYPLASHVIITEPISHRKLHAKDFRKKLSKSRQQMTSVAPSFNEVMGYIHLRSQKNIPSQKKTTNTLFVVCGSFYLCQPFHHYLQSLD